MSIKHTPGPWNVFKGGRGGFIYFGVSGIAHMTPAYVEAQSAPAETMQANAYLIAAAPELFEAARAAAKSHMMYGKVMQRDIDALINAIHKAQGGDL